MSGLQAPTMVDAGKWGKADDKALLRAMADAQLKGMKEVGEYRPAAHLPPTPEQLWSASWRHGSRDWIRPSDTRATAPTLNPEP